MEEKFQQLIAWEGANLGALQGKRSSSLEAKRGREKEKLHMELKKLWKCEFARWINKKKQCQINKNLWHKSQSLT